MERKSPPEEQTNDVKQVLLLVPFLFPPKSELKSFFIISFSNYSVENIQESYIL